MAGSICPDHPNFLSISKKAVSLSYHAHGHWSSTFNSLGELFPCIHNLADGRKKPSLQPFSAFNMPSSLSGSISSSWRKVRDARPLLSPEHLEAMEGLLTGLISIVL